MARPVTERFWEKVSRPIDPDGCWEWSAGLTRGGYGLFFDPALPTRRAHRIAYLLAVGPIPDGLDVCHSCDYRRCCRPSHLWLGTRAENNRDMAAKGRARGGHPGMYGESATKHKLTHEQASAILAAKRAGGSTKELAERYGVSRTLIKRIAAGRTWPHLANAA